MATGLVDVRAMSSLNLAICCCVSSFSAQTPLSLAFLRQRRVQNTPGQTSCAAFLRLEALAPLWGHSLPLAFPLVVIAS